MYKTINYYSLFGFHQFFSTNGLFLFEEPVDDTILYLVISPNFLQSVTFSLFPCFFLILTFLKSTGQTFCRISCNLVLSDVFSCLDSGLDFAEVWYPSYHIIYIIYQELHAIKMTMLVMLTLNSWLRWCLLGFSTVNYCFSFPCSIC